VPTTQHTFPLLATWLLCLTLSAPGCQSAPPPAPAASSQVLTRLYFGLSRPGGEVSSVEFEAFVDAEITTRFPSGFTLFEARGAWRDRETGQTQREPSRVLEVLHRGASEAQFEALIERYKERFQQQAVLRIDLPAKARF
jgi:uncharacterized protein DUF3574